MPNSKKNRGRSNPAKAATAPPSSPGLTTSTSSSSVQKVVTTTRLSTPASGSTSPQGSPSPIRPLSPALSLGGTGMGGGTGRLSPTASLSTGRAISPILPASYTPATSTSTSSISSLPTGYTRGSTSTTTFTAFERVDDTPFWKDHSRVNERVRELREALDRFKVTCSTPSRVELPPSLSSRVAYSTSDISSSTALTNASLQSKVEKLESDLSVTKSELERERKEATSLRNSLSESQRGLEKQTTQAGKAADLQAQLTRLQQGRQSFITTESELRDKIASLERQIITGKERDRQIDSLKAELSQCNSRGEDQFQQIQLLKRDNEDLRSQISLLQISQRSTPSPLPSRSPTPTYQSPKSPVPPVRSLSPISGSVVNLSVGQNLNLAQGCGKVRMGLGWNSSCDLDASVLLLDVDGKYHDHVYFGKQTSKEGAIKHWGDHLTGEGEGDDESIDVDLERVSQKAVFLFFTVTVYTDGKDFGDVEGARCRLMDVTAGRGSPKAQGTALAQFNLSTFAPGNRGLIFVCLHRDPDRKGSWKMAAVGEGASGKNYRDLEPDCSRICQLMTGTWSTSIRDWVKDEYDRQLRIARPSTPVQLSSWGKAYVIPHFMNTIRMGLGWDTKTDLDASVVVLDLEGKYWDHVYFGRKASKEGAIRHAGDNTTGEGEGDDECIDVDLSKVSREAAFLFFTVTVYSDDQTFMGVKGAFCRLLDMSSVGLGDASPKETHQICHFNLSQSAGKNTAQIFACLYRDPERIGGWKMMGLGEPAEGRAARDLEPKCTELAAKLKGKEEQVSYKEVWSATTTWALGDQLTRTSTRRTGGYTTTTTTRVVTQKRVEQTRTAR